MESYPWRFSIFVRLVAGPAFYFKHSLKLKRKLEDSSQEHESRRQILTRKAARLATQTLLLLDSSSLLSSDRKFVIVYVAFLSVENIANPENPDNN